MISLLLDETKVEPRLSVITMISSEYTGYNCLMEIRNYVITSCLRKARMEQRFNTTFMEFAIHPVYCGMQPMWEDGLALDTLSFDVRSK